LRVAIRLLLHTLGLLVGEVGRQLLLELGRTGAGHVQVGDARQQVA